MNKNQSSRYGLAAYALVIPLILLCMVFSYAFAQDKPVRDTVKMFTSVQQQKPESTPENALILLDGKVIDKATMDAMSPDAIYSVNVLKGKSATDVYGKKGKNGVVLITSKKPETKDGQATATSNGNVSTGTSSSTNGKILTYMSISDGKGDSKSEGKAGTTFHEILTSIGIQTSSGTDAKRIEIHSDTDYKFIDGKLTAYSVVNNFPDDALFILDGKEVKIRDIKIKTIKSIIENVKSISILKGEAATAVYGAKGEKGVIIITSKKK